MLHRTDYIIKFTISNEAIPPGLASIPFHSPRLKSWCSSPISGEPALQSDACNTKTVESRNINISICQIIKSCNRRVRIRIYNGNIEVCIGEFHHIER